jgi:hypothetical protein
MTLCVRAPRIRPVALYKDVCVYWSWKQYCILLDDGNYVVLCFIVGAT